MIKDGETQLSDNQAVTASAASSNYYDAGATGTPPQGAQALTRELTGGEAINFLAQVVTAFTAAGAGTLTLALQTDDNTGFSSATEVWNSGAIPKATLVAGYEFNISYLPKVNERYFRLYYTVATGPMTAGNIDAAVVAARQGGIGS